MDAAVAARETAQLVYFNANFRLFKFIFLFQEGYSQKDRIERFNTNLGVDSRGSILKLEEVRQAMASILQSSSHRFLVGLSFFTMKLSAVCKGGVGLETDVMDSLDIFLLQDFVISKASSASINGVSIIEKFDDDNFLKTAVRNFVSFLSLVGGSDLDESFWQLVDWANGLGDSGMVLGPVTYTGRTRLFFAKTIFAGIIKSIMSLRYYDCIRSRVEIKIESTFTKWANVMRVSLHGRPDLEDPSSRNPPLRNPDLLS